MAEKQITIMDGGMGRLLEKMGAPFRQPEWSALPLMEAPEYVSRAHQAFVDAGAQIIITNSYALVPFHIGQEKFDRDGRSLMKLAAQIARDVADTNDANIKVAGSLPPAFGSYRPDLFDAEKAADIYRPLIEEQEPYVDYWLAETISSTQEARVIHSLLEKSKKPFWISYTLADRDGEDTPPQIRSGESVEKAVQTAIELGAKAILFNCSQPEEMAPALKIIQNMDIDITYGCYANAFPAIKKNKLANDEITTLRADACPENYLKLAKEWKTLGASIIGGCCGIGPDHIKALENLNKE